MAPTKPSQEGKKRKAATHKAQPSSKATASEGPSKKSKLEKPPTNEQPAPAAVTEEYFPRGGASVLTPLEYREVADQAKQDVLFEQTEPDQKPKQKKKRRRADDEMPDGDGTKKMRTSETTYAETLSFKRLNVGMTLLGCIKEINDLDLAISLPDHLNGYVSITDISEPITDQVKRAAGQDDDSDSGDDDGEGVPDLRDMFHVGQIVACVITGLEQDTAEEVGDKAGRRRVALSLKPEAINANLTSSDLTEGMMLAATVTSEEDHGYVLSFGLSDISGFVLKKNASTFVSEKNGGRPLKIGQVIYGSVLKLDEARRTASITLAPEAISKSVIPGTHALSFDSLKAGEAVNAKVKAVLDNGLSLSFLGVLEGTVNLAHIGAVVHKPEEELNNMFKTGQKIRARILYVDPSRKKIALTLRPNLLQWTPPEFPLASIVDIGTIIEGFVVTRVDAKLGVLVEHPQAGVAFVHISRLADKKVEKIEKNFKVGSAHRGRVLGFDYCDGLLDVTFQQSILEQTFLRYQDIQPGATVKGKIVRLADMGVIIALSNTINALCPKIHLADIVLSQPEKMFKVGASVKCQVLSVDTKNKRVILTHKKSLMGSNLMKITSYQDAKVGDLSHGVITAIKDFGCIVTFFNDVRALVPLSELSDKFVEKPSDLFRVGQVVKCRVISVSPAEEKMRASFKLMGTNSRGSANFDSISMGQIVAGSVISILTDGVLIELKPSLVRGYLPKVHLTDHIATADKLYKGMQEGMNLEELLVIRRDQRKGQVTLSMKGLLIEEARRRQATPTLDDYKEGMVIPGYINNVTDRSCYVSFLGDVAAMVKLHNISDRFVSKASDFVQVGQTVLAAVTRMDAEHRRLEASLKHSQCAQPEVCLTYETALLRSLFREQDRAHFADKNKAKIYRALINRFHIGGLAEGVVSKVMPYGVIVELQDGVSGLITKHPEGVQLAVGTRVKGRIMDVDPEKKIVDMVVYPDVTPKNARENVDEVVIKKAKAALEKSGEIEGIVQVVKEEYAIITLPTVHNAVACALAKNFNSHGTPFIKFRVGQRTKVKVTRIPTTEDAKQTRGTANQRILVVPVLDKEQPQDVLDTRRTVKNPFDLNFKALEDFTLGARVKGKIVSIKDTQMNVSFGSNLKGRVHVTQVADTLEDILDPKHPFQSFKIGQVVESKVLGFHDAKTHRSLPFSHRNSVAHTVVELTMKSSELTLPNFDLSDKSKHLPTLGSLELGSRQVGFVQSVDSDVLWIQISINLLGRANLVDVQDPNVMRKPQKHYPAGTAVACWVVGKDTEKQTLDLSLKEFILSLDFVQAGQIVVGRIKKVEPERGLLIQVSSSLVGRVHLTDMSDSYVKDPTAGFRSGSVVQCCIIGVDRAKNQLDLSLRDSRVKGTKPEVTNVEVKDIQDVQPDTVISGYIRNVSDAGCFVSINHKLSARVKIAELSDAYIKDWKSEFKMGQLVRGRIVSVNTEQSRLEMSLKQSVVDPDAGGVQITWEHIEKRQKVKGFVKKIAEFGIFIQLSQSVITGLCHKSELSDNPVNAIDKLYSVGDAVKAVVLKVDRENKKLSLGLKASYFNEEDYAEQDEMDVDDKHNEPVEDEHPMDVDAEEESDNNDEIDMDSQDDETSFMHSIGDSDEEQSEDDTGIDDMEGLDVGGFDWDMAEDYKETEAQTSESEDEDEEDGPSSKKKSRRAKKRAKREEEERIAQKEQSLLEGDKAPELAEDFERLLLGSPNSSFLWIKFMAFQLQMAEVDKARQVAERALKAIHFREEQEKMNVWVALMNLENTYGTQESLLKVFERAVAMNEPKAVYMHLIRIYERTEKWDLAEQLYQVAVKKFNKSSKVWTSFGLFQLKRGKVDEARKILQRSLQSLAKRKHVKTICKFAQMEFKYGESERGRTIFEGIMSNYPKRVDLWSIYLDMEIRNGDVAITRRLFERVIHMKFSSKKMKFFFKKYLDYEKKQGTPETVDHVKQAAIAYVEQLQNE